ncbi:MAG TPA: response regulator [Thermoanaerobaculia bacterium]|nr:response regulator [Thermoanaerobaculia bacterium]
MARKKILLVDDSPTILLMEKMILAQGGYELVVAVDGEDGLLKAREHNPDLILLDVVMPGKNGLEVLQALRQEEATRSVPVIMVTTRSEADKIEAAYTIGCADYVTKPINGLELITKVTNCIGASR